MTITGGDNFTGGVTRRERISQAEKAILRRCSGFSFRLGYLTPENVCSRLSTGGALTGTTPEQTPYAFADDDSTIVVCRDADEKMRDFISATFGSAGSVCDIVADALPSRYRTQLIFPTQGPDPKLMAYEPNSPSTKLRPLSLRSPAEYKLTSSPQITPSVAVNSTGASMTATTIAFVENGASPDTITDSGTGFVTAGFLPGQTIQVSGSASNDGTYLINTVAAGTLTLDAAEDLVAESVGASVTIRRVAEVSITASTLAFVDSGPDTITDSGNAFVSSGFSPGQTITVSGSTSNDGTYMVAAVAAGTLTLEAVAALTVEAAGAAVTISAAVGVTLFDCNDSQTDWVKVAVAAAVVTDGDTATCTIDAAVTTEDMLMKKDLGATGIGLTGKPFLIFDMLLSDDEQSYTQVGLFGNDEGLMPSGYLIGLYSDQTCSTLVQSYRIPKLTTSGKVHRVALNIGTRTDTIKGVAILTDSFWTPPISGKTFTMKLYSEVFNSLWTHKGNFLMPPVLYKQSTWAKTLSDMLNVTFDLVDLPPSNNPITDGDFEDGDGSDWNLDAGADVTDDRSNSGRWSLELDHTNEAATSPFYTTNINPGSTYILEYQYAAQAGGDWLVTAQPYNGATPLAETTFTYSAIDSADGWRQMKEQMVLPLLTTKVRFYFKATATNANFSIDDVAFYMANQALAGSAAILQTFNPDGSIREPEVPIHRYAICYVAKDRLSVDLYALQVSNPSDFSNPSTVSDPWRSYSVVFTVPTGPIATAVLGANAGTGYTVNDVLTVDGGTDGKVKVLTITGGGGTGPIGTLSLLTSGSGYSDANEAATSGGTGSAATVDTTTVDAIDEYGNYLTHGAYYRQEYDPVLQVWSAAKFIGKVAMAATMTLSDAGNDDINTIDGVEVPLYLEIDNDYAPSAKHTAYMQRRIYAAVLNWDNEDEIWHRPTAIAVSNFDGVGFPTNDGDEVTDGAVLDGYEVTGSIVRGLLPRNDELYVWLDNEFFVFRGDNPILGWRETRLDSIGLDSCRTLADCRRAIIWKYGNEIYRFTGGLAEPIAIGRIDPSLIDLTEPHNAVYFDDYYILYCNYGGDKVLLQYDLKFDAWRIRYSDALDFVGICADADTVYGLKPDGNMVSLFGSSTSDYGAASTIRDAGTQYMRVSPPMLMAQVDDAALEIVTTEASIDVSLTVEWQGAKNGSVAAKTITATSDVTDYRQPQNLQASAARVALEYTGTTPPDIHFIGVDSADAPAATAQVGA